jgi:DNA mismatch repair protein MutS
MYLAHIGMAVPAKAATMSVFSAIFSSISPTDNLTAGYSYFYSEVMRVKEAVDKLKETHQYSLCSMSFSGEPM